MSNLSEAAAENDDKAGDPPAGPAMGRAASAAGLAAADRKAPFDFRLKLDLGGARSAERGLPLFERRIEPRSTPTFVPTVVPEPLVVEPIEFSLEMLAVPTATTPPVELPTSDQASLEASPDDGAPVVVAEVATPVLPKPPSRAVPAEPTPTDDVAAPASPSRVAPPRRPDTTIRPVVHKRRKKGKPMLVPLVLLGLLGAGGFLFIKQRDAAQERVKEWPSALKPLAAFVEQTLGHPFTRSVPVKALPQAEYEAKLGILELERVPKDATGGFSGLRALGLISEAPSAAAVGQYVGLTRTAFYDPSTTTVYESADVTGQFQDANLMAAMSVALLDQTKKWGAAMATLSPAQQLGYLSLIEGTGTFVIRQKSRQDTAFADRYTTEHAARVARRDALPSKMSPWLLGLFDMQLANSWGIVTRSLHGDFIDALNAPESDAAVLDSARGIETPAGVLTTDPSSLGMYVWYGVLYPSLGDDLAFHMASAWTGDSVLYSIADGRGCVRASVATRDSASLTDLVNGLNLWAKSRPADTTTTVEARGTVAVVTACESSGPIAINATSAVRQDFQGRLVKEQVLIQQLSRLAMPLTNPAIACAVNSYRADGLAGFDEELAAVATNTEGTISPALRQSLLDLATFCGSAR